MTNDKFDLEIVHDCFMRSLKDADNVVMDLYLEGFKELYKFFQLLGTVFGFVSSDVRTKVDILESFRKKDNAEDFSDFKSMIEYEKSSGLLEKKDYESGSRTLLRLHRGLDFVRAFLREMGKLEPNDKTCAACQLAYNETLAKYHPWLIRKGATVAMYALPTRDQLLKKVSADSQRSIDLLPSVLDVTKQVFDRTQDLYTLHDLHGLP